MSDAEKNPAGTTVTFLGTRAVVPDAGADSASFLIGRHTLVDTGWYAAVKMQSYGFDPLDIDTLIFTHCHHDHYLGLPALLFTFAMRTRERPNKPPLKIIGPAGEIERVVALAEAFLQTDRFPPVRVPTELIPLAPVSAFKALDYQIETRPSVHPVPGLCYRYTDKRTGAVLAFTGDTAYAPSLPALFRDAGLLIHEASYGARPAPAENTSLHSGAPDAARVALEAGVKRLALIHCPRPQQTEALASARALFSETIYPEEGERVVVE